MSGLVNEAETRRPKFPSVRSRSKYLNQENLAGSDWGGVKLSSCGQSKQNKGLAVLRAEETNGSGDRWSIHRNAIGGKVQDAR